MAFEIPKTTYSGKIKEIKLGKGDKAVIVGGESCYPFYLFEGDMPRLPRIAMEVYDSAPRNGQKQLWSLSPASPTTRPRGLKSASTITGQR